MMWADELVAYFLSFLDLLVLILKLYIQIVCIVHRSCLRNSLVAVARDGGKVDIHGGLGGNRLEHVRVAHDDAPDRRHYHRW